MWPLDPQVLIIQTITTHHLHHPTHTIFPKVTIILTHAQLSSAVDRTVEDSTHEVRQHHQPDPAFIRSQDVNTRLTPGLAVPLDQTSPLAPYNIRRRDQPKARPSRPSALCAELLSGPL